MDVRAKQRLSYHEAKAASFDAHGFCRILVLNIHIL
jgi:hypothetical protein